MHPIFSSPTWTPCKSKSTPGGPYRAHYESTGKAHLQLRTNVDDAVAGNRSNVTRMLFHICMCFCYPHQGCSVPKHRKARQLFFQCDQFTPQPCSDGHEDFVLKQLVVMQSTTSQHSCGGSTVIYDKKINCDSAHQHHFFQTTSGSVCLV